MCFIISYKQIGMQYPKQTKHNAFCHIMIKPTTKKVAGMWLYTSDHVRGKLLGTGRWKDIVGQFSKKGGDMCFGKIMASL